MSVSHIKDSVKMRLWGKAAGRCQYAGCNKPLWYDSTTNFEFNSGYIAHIVADKPNGPRGDAKLSEILKSDISNLMILCDAHHRLIDIEDVGGHPPELLKQMKAEHEKRIELLSGFQKDKQSQVVFYGANIGSHTSPLNHSKASMAMIESYGYYPAELRPISLGLRNSSYYDNDLKYWDFEEENLVRQYNHYVKERLRETTVSSLSVFALAPQPLLVKLGHLLGDIENILVFQKRREPDTWTWLDDTKETNYIQNFNGVSTGKDIALVLSLSANISSNRIYSTLGDQIPILEITHENPHNDFLRNRSDLRNLRSILRKTFNTIKLTYGEDARIHVFPAAPNSACIELGRVWMAKVDLPLIIYDQNKKHGTNFKSGFYQAISIS